MPEKVLIVPACKRGQGGGHLSRSLLLLKALQPKGFDTYLWIPEELKDDFILRFKEFFKTVNRLQILSRRDELEGHDWKFIVFDRFRTSPKEFAQWCPIDRRSAPFIGIDEGGPCRNSFDFLIDLLPAIPRHKPNISAPGLLPLPKNRRSAYSRGDEPLRVLISFGAEDAAGLGIIAARRLALNASFLITPSSLPDITLVAPIPPEKPIPGVRVMARIPHLMEHLAEYDLFITHYGLGAFEAVYARLPVLLLHPTRYHKKLAKNSGFCTLTGPNIDFINHEPARTSTNSRKTKIYDIVDRTADIARKYGLEVDQNEDISSFIAGLAPHSPNECPACARHREAWRLTASPAIARFPEETYRRCRHCGIIYLARLRPPPFEYGREYFFDQYKKQYGKTYLEDFPNLLELARKRLTHIINHEPHEPSLTRGKRSLLDIGCAYGPFLVAASEAGFAPQGLEPCEDAARYVSGELGFPCRQGFFPQALEGPFDVVTLWYVIEHFKEPGKTLREIHGLLKEGGILALSTPSFSGISGRKSLKNFLKKSPADHWTVWNSGACKKILKQQGFRLCKIVITGHHPERFPLLGRFVEARSAASGKEGLLYHLLLLISRLFRLGDGFEAYAVKLSTKK